MTAIIVIWIASSILALGPVVAVAWRARRAWVDTNMRYVIIILIGAAVNNLVSAGLAIAALFRTPVPFGTELLTFGHLCAVVPPALFALHWLRRGV